jgi:hypothetical protein
MQRIHRPTARTKLTCPLKILQVNVESDPTKGADNEASVVYGRADPCGVAGAEAGFRVCCKHGISSATFYKWKAKFGRLDVS